MHDCFCQNDIPTNVHVQVNFAVMETFDWWVVVMNLKVVWRSALEFGGQCVMIFGIQMMQELSAGSLVTLEEMQVLESMSSNL